MNKTATRVLVVDDSETDVLHMGLLLKRLGCSYHVVRDGETGVAEALSGSYDFILMDLEMPGVDGWDATRQIHRVAGPGSPFIAAVTAHNSDGDIRKCAAAGMDYVLVKPVSLAALRDMLVP